MFKKHERSDQIGSDRYLYYLYIYIFSCIINEIKLYLYHYNIYIEREDRFFFFLENMVLSFELCK